MQKEFTIRKRLRKRKIEKTISQQDESEENSEDDGPVTKDWECTRLSTYDDNSIDQETINISDDDENRNDLREPSRFDPTVEPTQINGPQFKSVRDFFGEDEAVYIMDAKTTGNIGRYLNVSGR